MLRIGIIGCGSIFVMHAKSVAYCPDAQLVGVCDVKKELADDAAAKYNVKAYYDYKELITKELIDVVHICVPHYLHSVITRYALKQGVHVLCEKPMSISYEDAVENVNLAQKQNLRYGIIFQCRYSDSAKFVKESLDNGSLGKVISARVVLTWNRQDEYYSLSDWKGTWDKEGGGVVINQAIHSLDLANWFIQDEVESVQACLSNRNHPNVEVEDTAEGFIRYKNGAKMGFWAMNNYGCDDSIEIRLFCENGNVIMDNNKAEIIFNNGKVLSAKPIEDSEITYENQKTYWGTQHIRQIADFYQSVKNGTQPFVSAKEALKIQKLVCEIYRIGRKE